MAEIGFPTIDWSIPQVLDIGVKSHSPVKVFNLAKASGSVAPVDSLGKKNHTSLKGVLAHAQDL